MLTKLVLLSDKFVTLQGENNKTKAKHFVILKRYGKTVKNEYIVV